MKRLFVHKYNQRQQYIWQEFAGQRPDLKHQQAAAVCHFVCNLERAILAALVL